MIRGLYFKLRGARLPLDCGFESRRLSSLDYAMMREGRKSMKVNGLYRLGGGVFAAEMICASEEPAVSMWWLWFYESVCVIVDTWAGTQSPHPLCDVAGIVHA